MTFPNNPAQIADYRNNIHVFRKCATCPYPLYQRVDCTTRMAAVESVSAVASATIR